MKKIPKIACLMMRLALIPSICSLPISMFLLAQGGHASQLPQSPTVPTKQLAQNSQKGAAATNPALEPKAIAILKAMGDRLAKARTITFTAVSTYENPSRLGPPLVYTTTSDVALQRPNKLQVITPGDGPPSEFYYNGKTIVAYAPNEKVVAITDAPPTIDAALQAADEAAAIYFPFTDVLVADPYKDIADGLKLAFYIGQSQVIGGTTTDMIAIANDKVFAQVWIGTKDQLPRMIRVVYKDDPSRLRHQVALSNWKLDGSLPPDAFTSSRASNAKRIPFKRPDPPAPPTPQAPPPIEPPRLTP